MKKLLLLFALAGLFASCGSDDPAPSGSGLTIDDSQLAVTLTGSEGAKQTVRFTAHESWSADVSKDWCILTPASGEAGNISLTVSATANTTGANRTATVTLRAGGAQAQIQVTQTLPETLSVTPPSFRVKSEGEEIEFKVTANVAYECNVDKDSQSWIEQIAKTEGEASGTMTVTTYRFRVLPYDQEGRRTGTIVVSNNQLRQEITVEQGTIYVSTDYSRDREVITLQTADEGNGINLVLMGDAFTDRLVADGTYEQVMKNAVDAFFSTHPYSSFRHLFNIYAVVAISANEEYFEGASTVFEGKFGEGTEVSGRNQTCKSYAREVPGMSATKLDETVIIVMMNRKFYAGTCYMSTPVTKTDYGSGPSIAYFPLGTDDEMFKVLLTHEAGGHGFAKLADEYSFPSYGSIPATEIEKVRDFEKYGWLKNIDLTNDPEKIKWSSFISDERYASENIGVYAGGYTYPRGIYHPTKSSIMNDNTGGFNAPSREAIYYRIHKLAYGSSWEYDREKFVEFDLAAQRNMPQAAPRRMPEHYAPLHAPVILPQLFE